MGEAATALVLSDQQRNDIQEVVNWAYKHADVADPMFNLPDVVDEFAHPEKYHDCPEEEE